MVLHGHSAERRVRVGEMTRAPIVNGAASVAAAAAVAASSLCSRGRTFNSERNERPNRPISSSGLFAKPRAPSMSCQSNSARLRPCSGDIGSPSKVVPGARRSQAQVLQSHVPQRAFSTSLAQPGTAVTELFELLHARRNDLAMLDDDLAALLRKRMDAIQASDLGVKLEDAARIAGSCGLAYQDVHSDADLTLCIFVMRAGACIPMHDHPGMNVYGRLLFGKLHVLSYDMDFSVAPPRGLRGACWGELQTSEVIGPSPVTFTLSPSEGNLHELRALEDCAFFDVLSPPYDPWSGRDCTYYRREAEDGSGRCVLVPTRPWNFSMDSLSYRGPSFPSV